MTFLLLLLLSTKDSFAYLTRSVFTKQHHDTRSQRLFIASSFLRNNHRIISNDHITTIRMFDSLTKKSIMSTTSSLSSSRTAKLSSEYGSSTTVVPIGGDFCGISATFDPMDGTFIPIPEYMIPDALIEWGQQPTTLEIITSEDNVVVDDEQNHDNLLWNRQIITVSPEIGCALDNQMIQKSKEVIESNHIWQNRSTNDDDQHITIVQQSLRYVQNKCIVETMFGWIIPDHRIRVVVTVVGNDNDDVTTDLQQKQSLLSSNIKLIKPVTIIIERQFDINSSNGTIGNGGGLDARSVSDMLGVTIQKYRQNHFPITKQQKGVVLQNDNDNNDDNNTTYTTTIYPGNVTIALIQQEQNHVILEVGYIMMSQNDSDNDDEHQQQQQRHVVRRSFLSSSLHDTKVESYIEQII